MAFIFFSVDMYTKNIFLLLTLLTPNTFGVSYDEWLPLDENENEIITSSSNIRVELNDWDSSLYGKPICQKIPSNMSLCSGISYSEMKIPNLLGHETLDEVRLIVIRVEFTDLHEWILMDLRWF
jgi:hypothetical protein